jgi:hypothetical protein
MAVRTLTGGCFCGAGAHDARCAACGSFLWSVVADGAAVHVTLGSLVDAPSMTPDHHIFAGSKAPWDAILDDLPQYDGYRTTG